MTYADLGAGRPGEPGQRADLVEHVRGHVVRGQVHLPPAEADQVRVRHLGADHDPAGRRRGHGAQQRARVAGVEAAGHVRAGDHVEDGLVVAERPGAVRLADVGVEVDHRSGTRALVPGSSPRPAHAVGVVVQAAAHVVGGARRRRRLVRPAERAGHQVRGRHPPRQPGPGAGRAGRGQPLGHPRGLLDRSARAGRLGRTGRVAGASRTARTRPLRHLIASRLPTTRRDHPAGCERRIGVDTPY